MCEKGLGPDLDNASEVSLKMSESQWEYKSMGCVYNQTDLQSKGMRKLDKNLFRLLI